MLTIFRNRDLPTFFVTPSCSVTPHSHLTFSLNHLILTYDLTFTLRFPTQNLPAPASQILSTTNFSDRPVELTSQILDLALVGFIFSFSFAIDME